MLLDNHARDSFANVHTLLGPALGYLMLALRQGFLPDPSNRTTVLPVRMATLVIPSLCALQPEP